MEQERKLYVVEEHTIEVFTIWATSPQDALRGLDDIDNYNEGVGEHLPMVAVVIDEKGKEVIRTPSYPAV